MRMNTDLEGLAAIFKDWHVPLIDELFRRQETYPELEDRELGTGDAWRFLDERGVKTSRSNVRSVSRASVIYFLKDLEEEGILNFRETTGKGGHFKLYEMAMTREQFNKTIIVKFLRKLAEIFPEESANLQPAVDAVARKA